MGPSRPGRARPCRGCRGRTATMGSGRGRGWGGGGPGAGRPAGSARRPPRRVRSFAGACGPLVLPADLCERLRALGREQGATLFMVLLAGFYALLQRYSGQDDLVVGSAIAGRQRPELEGLIGFFVNTLVLRCRPERRRGFRELVARVRELTLAAYAHQDLPFEILVERLQPERDLSRNPLFQVSFQLFSSPLAAAPPAEDARLELVESERGSAIFDLAVNLGERGRAVVGAIEYASDLFEPATIAQLARHYRRLLEQALAEPE